MTSRIAIAGSGAVSPAGWSAGDLADAVSRGRPIATESHRREGTRTAVRVRRVPPPEKKPLRHPRLRRASLVARFAVAAAREALGSDRVEAVQNGELRLGVILNVVNGCVNYSRTFYAEVLADPPTASPILFPETVLNSPASYIAAILGTTSMNYTLLGDSTQFLSGVDLAAGWLVDGLVDGCIVAGAEELDPLSYEAVQIFDRDTVVSEGAGAIYLERAGSDRQPAVELVQVTPAVPYSRECPPPAAAEAVRSRLPGRLPDELICVDKDRHSGRSGDHFAVRETLGFGIAATTAWQTVFAHQALLSGRYTNAIVLGDGTDQQCIGAHLRRNP